MKRLLLASTFIAFLNVVTGQSIFINEIHYDNASTDVDEGIEVAGPAGTDLTNYTLQLYNGNGGVMYGTTVNLTGTIPNQQNNYGTINFPISGLQNGAPDGIALIDDLGQVIQFLSYEGTMVAADGPAVGLTSEDVGVTETTSTPVGESIQLIGTGTVYTDFTWTNQTQTRDAVNTNQFFGAAVPTVSFDLATVTVDESAGTLTVDVLISNEDTNPTSVDVVLGTSTATLTNDFTYTSPTTVTFPASSNATQSVTVTIVDDVDIESSEDIVLELQNVTNSGAIGANPSHTISITDNDSPTPPSISFDVATVDVNENAGTISINLDITNENASTTSVDVSLGTSTATDVLDFTYTSPTTVTFPGSSTTTQVITLDIVDDVDMEQTEMILLEMSNFTNSATAGTNSTYTINIFDNDTPIIPACSDLFFSEYIEGSSFNKALEIYNPTNNVIDLSDYEIRMYGNGSPTPTSTFIPSGIIVPGGVYMVVNSQADQGILDVANETSGITNFNGDDALELYNTATTSSLDIIGEIGVDPGASWPVSTGATKDFTLVRMSNVDAGMLTWIGAGDAQWDVYTIDDVTNLGSHSNAGCIISVPLTAYPTLDNDTVCLQETINFNDNSFGGTAPYTIAWDFGDGNNDAGAAVSHTYAASGSFTVTMVTTDATLATDDSVFTVHVNALPTATLADTVVCIGGTATLEASVTGGATPYSYLWSEGSTTSTINPMPINDSILSVVVTDSNGCVSGQASANVTLYQPLSVTAMSDQTICEGDTADISATATGGLSPFTYTWDQSVGAGSSQSVNPSQTTIYTVTAEDVCETPAATSTVTITVNPSNADFSFSGEPTVAFADLSSGTVSTYAWDFGDGNTSSSAAPSNTYLSDADYTVCLEVTTDLGCVDSICKIVSINSTDIAKITGDDISVYPNPSIDGFITVDNVSNQNLSIEVSNIIGQKVWNGSITNTSKLDFSSFIKGTYFIKISSKEKSTTKKIILK